MGECGDFIKSSAASMRRIKFRPHHFLCAFCFEGKGYSPAFIKNFYEVLKNLNQDQKIEIEVTEALDSICAPCPHHSQGSCSSDKTIQILDRAHAEILEIKEGDRLSWEDALSRIETKMTLQKFHRACVICRWKKLGVCEAKLRGADIT